jgi:hypothetical protein
VPLDLFRHCEARSAAAIQPGCRRADAAILDCFACGSQ